MRLYRLEWMKIRRSTYLWAILGVFTGLLALGILFLFIPQLEGEGGGVSRDAELFASWDGLLALTTALAFSCFSILAAAIAAKVIVSEYCGKNAVILLTYPARRKAILRAKCVLVCGVTMVSASISNILVVGAMYATAYMFDIMPQMNTEHFALTVLLSSIFMGILSSAASIISTVFGWKKRSIIAPLVCSLLIVCAAANFIAASPNHLNGIMLVMSAAFVMIAYFTYHMLANGIEKMEI